MTPTNMERLLNGQVTKVGITLFGLQFNSDALQRLRKEGALPKNATVLFNPDDIRVVGVKFVGEPIFALTSKALHTCDEPISLEEWVAAYNAAKSSCDAGVRNDS